MKAGRWIIITSRPSLCTMRGDPPGETSLTWLRQGIRRFECLARRSLWLRCRQPAWGRQHRRMDPVWPDVLIGLGRRLASGLKYKNRLISKGRKVYMESRPGAAGTEMSNVWILAHDAAAINA